MKTKRLLITSTVLALTSCASYSASPLCNPSPDLIQIAPRNEGILVISKPFNHLDCNKFLDRDVISEGYQPIQIHIQNYSNESYIFSLNRISLPVARPEEVAEKVHTNTLGRIVGYSVGALFFLPLAIPAIVDGINSSDANDALDNDFVAKAAHDQIIFPHSHLNSIIFVPVNAYQNSFTLTLINKESNQPKTFNL